MPNEPRLSAADRKARERLYSREEFARVPVIDPAVGVNRAKQQVTGDITAPTDTNNPGATAQVGGADVKGQESPAPLASGLSTEQVPALPDGISPNALTALKGAGVLTLADSLKYTDAQLDAIPGIAAATIKTLRDAATAAGLTWAQPVQD